jgi:hypothetical protein
MAVFWVVVPCRMVEVYHRFRGPCCLHHQGDLHILTFSLRSKFRCDIRVSKFFKVLYEQSMCGFVAARRGILKVE